MTRDEILVHLAAAILANPNCAAWTPREVVQRAVDIDDELPVSESEVIPLKESVSALANAIDRFNALTEKQSVAPEPTRTVHAPEVTDSSAA